MLKILYIEDSLAIVEIAKIALQEGNKTIITHCITAEDGLAKLKIDTFDLVFTDLKLPKMSGQDMIMEIKKDFPELPIVVVSGTCELDAHIASNIAKFYSKLDISNLIEDTDNGLLSVLKKT